MSESMFDLPPKAPPELLAEWSDLADRVCRELALAGLSARRGDLDGGRPVGPGVAVHVDPFADGGSGVYVDWRTDEELTTAAVELFEKDIDFTDPPPLVRHHRDVHRFMQEALLGILASAGFEVEVPDPHTYGSAAWVKGLRA
ncbi:hypothetical protein [Streptomyces tanashiensis]|uniref:hypothetical protein n=1 Tax=Streptomyces tanashiensis TaxID=67367 RepID=UPI00167E66C6|nr:hypothetical protein [Streptomyces tanashiensis]GGY22176.1 hypothetical protein GCM10010299_30470 [Streptomyces tanashiensis]